MVPDGRRKSRISGGNKLLNARKGERRGDVLSAIALAKEEGLAESGFAHTPRRRVGPSLPGAAFNSFWRALSSQSPALTGKGLKQRCSDLTLMPYCNSSMKTNKVPRERNPFLLSGKRRWRLFRWIFRRTRRDGAANNLLSQDARPA
jgi:hypothetical protein